MAVHVPNHFPIRHIDRLPRPLVRGLATAVLFMHGILIAAALRSIPLVELGGSAGGGNGGGNRQRKQGTLRFGFAKQSFPVRNFG